MNWTHIEDKHFVDIEKFEDGSYNWIENNNCPQEPFLVGLYVGDKDNLKTEFCYWLVILTDNGLEEWTEGCREQLCYNITYIEFWCKIEKP